MRRQAGGRADRLDAAGQPLRSCRESQSAGNCGRESRPCAAPVGCLRVKGRVWWQRPPVATDPPLHHYSSSASRSTTPPLPVAPLLLLLCLCCQSLYSSASRSTSPPLLPVALLLLFLLLCQSLPLPTASNTASRCPLPPSIPSLLPSVSQSVLASTVNSGRQQHRQPVPTAPVVLGQLITEPRPVPGLKQT